MPATHLERRLDRLVLRQEAETVGKIVIIEPDTWPADVRDAYSPGSLAAGAACDSVYVPLKNGTRFSVVLVEGHRDQAFERPRSAARSSDPTSGVSPAWSATASTALSASLAL